MLVLSLMETGQRNTLSTVICVYEKKIQTKLRATLSLPALFYSPQFSTLTKHSLEERKGVDFSRGPQTNARDYTLSLSSHKPAVELLLHMLKSCSG